MNKIIAELFARWDEGAYSRADKIEHIKEALSNAQLPYDTEISLSVKLMQLVSIVDSTNIG